MRRREFITLAAGAVAAPSLLWPLAAHAQQPAMPVVGFLASGSPGPFAHMADAFRDGLKEAGFVDGQNMTIDYRWAEGQYDRLPALADDLIKRRVSVIFASGGVAPTQAAKAASSTIPVVFTSAYDPVGAGLVGSLSRPEGNVTGVTFFAGTLVAKRVELLRELMPGSRSIAMLANTTNPNAQAELREIERAAQTLGLQFQVVTANSEHDIDAIFAGFRPTAPDAVFIQTDPFFQSRRDLIISLAARYKVPTIYPNREFVTVGGLMSYGGSALDAYRQAGIYVGRILKGAKPGELPVVQPTRFELVINLATAKALGLEVPWFLQQRADEVIE